MNRRISLVVRRILIAGSCIGALAIAVTACGQGIGDRCQTDDDCDGTLVCNQATAKCANANSSENIDATTPDFLDAEEDIDAPIDTVDAMDDAVTVR